MSSRLMKSCGLSSFILENAFVSDIVSAHELATNSKSVGVSTDVVNVPFLYWESPSFIDETS